MSTLERTTQARLASKGMSAVKLIPLTTMRARMKQMQPEITP